MQLSRSISTAVLLTLLASLLALAPLTTAQAQSGPADLFISEYVEGSGFNKAIEIYNGTGQSVDLGAGEYALSLFSNGAASASQSVSLSGIVAGGDVLVIAHDDADAVLVAAADVTAPAVINFNGDDGLTLTRNGAVIDSFGQNAVDPGSQWAGGGQNDTLRRKATVCAGDADFTDAFDASTEWDTFAVDTFDGLGSHTTTCGPSAPQAPVINEFSASTTGTDVEYVELKALPDTDYSTLTVLEIEGDASSATGTVDSVLSMGTTDADGYFLLDLPANELENGTITLLLVEGFTGSLGHDLDADGDGAVDTPAPWTALVDDVAVNDGGSGDLTYSTTVLDEAFDDATVDSPFAPGGASRIPDGTDTDSTSDWVRNDFDLAPIQQGTPEEGEALNTPGAVNAVVGPPVVGPGLNGTPTLISAVQGSGATSPIEGAIVEISGIVTSLFEASDTLDAFFVQEEDADADSDPSTSEGVFVFCRGFCPAGLTVGDAVTVDGEVDEFFGMTQVEPASAVDILVTSAGNPLPTAAIVDLPASGSTFDEATFESVEGMVVTIEGTLAVAETFEQARYGHLRLITDERTTQFTQTNTPDQAGYDAYVAELSTRTIFLDDDNNTQNDPITGPVDEPYYFPTPGLSIDTAFRGGDTITNLTAVMHWSFAGQSGTDAWRLRPIQGTDYSFTSVNPRTASPDPVGGSLTVASFNVLNYFPTPDSGPNICGPLGSDDCRGADSAAEFERQKTKIVAALAEIDADVLGLIEIENADGAVQDLVDALNAVVGDGVYAQVDTGTIGTDAIKVGLIYKPSTVTLPSDFEIVDESTAGPGFDTSRNRPALVQTFTEIATGGSVTVVVNHLKSKGSPCGAGDDSPQTGAANCDGTRTAAAQALLGFLDANASGTIDEDVLIVGDLNSYAMEAPIQTIVGAGYTDLLAIDGQYTYEFDGQLGTLDYALSSQSLTSQVTGATAWNINSDELPLLDYNDDVQDPGENSFERESSALPLYEPTPYRSSDHDPVIVGLSLVPTIADAGGPYEVTVNGTVQLDGTGSTDGTGAGLTYAWDLDDDGVFDDAVGPTATFEGRGKGPGPRQVHLQVTDSVGVVSTSTATVDVLSNGNGNGGRPPGRYGRG